MQLVTICPIFCLAMSHLTLCLCCSLEISFHRTEPWTFGIILHILYVCAYKLYVCRYATVNEQFLFVINLFDHQMQWLHQIFHQSTVEWLLESRILQSFCHLSKWSSEERKFTFNDLRPRFHI